MATAAGLINSLTNFNYVISFNWTAVDVRVCVEPNVIVDCGSNRVFSLWGSGLTYARYTASLLQPGINSLLSFNVYTQYKSAV